MEEERGEGSDGEPGEPISETGVQGTGATDGKLGNEGELRGVELVHLGELVALVVVGGGEAVVGLAEHYEELLSNSRGIAVMDLTRDQLRIAAQLRAATGVKTPDALQLAAALGAGCTTFVTNDRRIPAIRGMRVLQLGDYET